MLVNICYLWAIINEVGLSIGQGINFSFCPSFLVWLMFRSSFALLLWKRDGWIFLLCKVRPDFDLQILLQMEQRKPTLPPAEAGKELESPDSSKPPPVAAASFSILLSAVRWKIRWDLGYEPRSPEPIGKCSQLQGPYVPSGKEHRCPEEASGEHKNTSKEETRAPRRPPNTPELIPRDKVQAFPAAPRGGEPSQSAQ